MYANEEANFLNVNVGASNSENLTEDIDLQDLMDKSGPIPYLKNRDQDFDVMSDSRLVLSGLGSVDNISAIPGSSNQALNKSQGPSKYDKKRMQSASIKKIIKQAVAAKTNKSNVPKNQMGVRNPKDGFDLHFSNSQTRNVGLNALNPHQAARNSLVI